MTSADEREQIAFSATGAFTVSLSSEAALGELLLMQGSKVLDTVKTSRFIKKQYDAGDYSIYVNMPGEQWAVTVQGVDGALIIDKSTGRVAPSKPLRAVATHEIIALARDINFSNWVERSRKTSFFEGTFDSMWLYYAPVDNGKPRLFSIGWNPERAKAEAMLMRPCADDQRSWLTRFIQAADALASRDDKRFRELVPRLGEDLRTLF